MHLRASLILALLLALAVPATAAAGPSRHLWATVNICDTKSNPDTIGLRARMPGNGTRQRMWMRFRTQYWHDDDYAWKYVTDGGRSPWIQVGSARFLWKETGYSFTFEPPNPGEAFRLRGIVQFHWRTKRGRVVRRTWRRTSAGHPSRGADPRGYSAGRCWIKNPAEPTLVAPKLVEPQPATP